MFCLSHLKIVSHQLLCRLLASCHVFEVIIRESLLNLALHNHNIIVALSLCKFQFQSLRAEVDMLDASWLILGLGRQHLEAMEFAFFDPRKFD